MWNDRKEWKRVKNLLSQWACNLSYTNWWVAVLQWRGPLQKALPLVDNQNVLTRWNGFTFKFVWFFQMVGNHLCDLQVVRLSCCFDWLKFTRTNRLIKRFSIRLPQSRLSFLRFVSIMLKSFVRSPIENSLSEFLWLRIEISDWKTFQDFHKFSFLTRNFQFQATFNHSLEWRGSRSVDSAVQSISVWIPQKERLEKFSSNFSLARVWMPATSSQFSSSQPQSACLDRWVRAALWSVHWMQAIAAER